MDIRKIIREEVNDFDWAEDVNVFSTLSDEDRKNVYRMRQALMDRGYTHDEAIQVLAQHHQPRKRFNHKYDEDTVYWTTDHGSSTFQFNYPPREGTLTKMFVDWIQENPGGTKQDFYSEVLGRPYSKGHNQQFWSSIVASGILRYEKGRNGRYKYYIGPNYEKWTEGKLKRYMGMNTPWRYGSGD
jgi:hypothetical protein